MENYPDYSERFRDLALDVLKHLGSVLLNGITGPHPLASHGDHTFEANHHIPFDDTDERMAHIDDMRRKGTLWQKTGPEFYDRRGYPIWPEDLEHLHKAEPLMHVNDDLRH
jgi:hypothetical protein